MEIDENNPLARIRDQIDRLDADIHRLLIDRSSVIDELIRIKGTSAPGAAFRPDREADMMRRMVMRHEGRLPLATVEHIWREIITVFTAMQAPFSVVSGPSDEPGRHRDMGSNMRMLPGRAMVAIPISVRIPATSRCLSAPRPVLCDRRRCPCGGRRCPCRGRRCLCGGRR